MIVVPEHFRGSNIRATDGATVGPTPSTVPALVSTLLKLLLLPILTGSAYCLAYAYVLGYFDSLGIPATLLTVGLGQLAIPGLLGAVAVLLIGLAYKTHVEIADQKSFTAQAYLWLPFLILAELLWPNWGAGIVI